MSTLPSELCPSWCQTTSIEVITIAMLASLNVFEWLNKAKTGCGSACDAVVPIVYNQVGCRGPLAKPF
jgi:hypothetical protein